MIEPLLGSSPLGDTKLNEAVAGQKLKLPELAAPAALMVTFGISAIVIATWKNP
jgi:hypothetical protein